MYLLRNRAKKVPVQIKWKKRNYLEKVARIHPFRNRIKEMPVHKNS